MTNLLGMMVLLKNFLETFWSELKTPFLTWVKVNSVPHKDKQLKNQLKKDADKELIEYWRSISLLNFDIKVI